MNRPLVIGLTGGIASGKSAVAAMFSQLGADVIDADKVGHAVLEQEEVKKQIEKQWGRKVIRDNRVSREQLAAIVFDPETGADQLEKLEAITHPKIKELISQRIGELQKNGAKAVILDAPLLFEAQWDVFCDKVLFVECDEEVRIQRALKRGWTREEFKSRESSQMTVAEKSQRATDLISNSGDLKPTEFEVRRLWLQWGLAKDFN